MGKIHKLDRLTSNKIAAGEVVEKPSSVVKELIENSIDAGATDITLEIKNGGKTLIKVSDNGVGMEKDDIVIAFERHATSKIQSIDDIYNIRSLGFRGEALASISSVSNIELITKTDSDDVGSKVILSGSKVLENKPFGCNTGTQIAIKDLFFNTPARLKFLKSNVAEQSSITEIINKLAISNCQIGFKYIVDSKTLFITKSDNNLKNTIFSIYGREIASNIIEVEDDAHGFKIYGFVSNLQLTRGNRQLQNIFVNNRYIKSDDISEAIKTAYKTMLPQGRHPICFMFIETDPSLVDVNVHPAKTEVKFENSSAIKQAVYAAVRKALISHDLIPKTTFTSKPQHDIRAHGSAVIDKIIPVEKIIDTIDKTAQAMAFVKDESKKPSENAVSEKYIANEDKSTYKPSTGNHSWGKGMVNPSDMKKQSENVIKVMNDINTALSDDTEVPKLPKVDRNITVIDSIIYSNDNNQSNALNNSSELDEIKVINDFDVLSESNDLNPSDEILNTKDMLVEKIDTPMDTETLIFEKNLFMKEDNQISIKSVNRQIEDTMSIYSDLRYIGVIFSTYLIFEKQGQMYMIDQHAAHEKILYEEFMELYHKKKIPSQILLDPLLVDLSYSEVIKVENNLDLFSAMGIGVEVFGKDAIVVREVPIMFNLPVTKEFILEVIEKIDENHIESIYTLKVESIIQASCKNAIKAHDFLMDLEIKGLLNRLKSLDDPYTCPHGRPIIISISMDEIMKKFKRT